MHPNPAFRQVPPEESLAFARDRGFGMLCINGEAGPVLAHVPFLVSADPSPRAELAALMRRVTGE